MIVDAAFWAGSLILFFLFLLPMSAYLVVKLGVLGWLRGKDSFQRLQEKENGDAT